MKTRRLGVLVVGVVVLVIASALLWFNNSSSLSQIDDCTTAPAQNPKVWLRKVKTGESILPNGRTVMTVSHNPGTKFEIADTTVFNQKMDELGIWDGTGIFSTQNMQYITPQRLCIILVPEVQSAGQLVSSTDENKVLQSYSSEYDYATATFKLYLHFDTSFYKEKAKDAIGFGNVISYAVMDSLYDLSTPEEQRVIDDLEKRRAGKKEFLEPFTAKNVQTAPSVIKVTQLTWPTQ